MASVRPIREEQLTLINEILNNTQKYNVGYTPQAKIIIELHLQQVLTVGHVKTFAHRTSLFRAVLPDIACSV